MHIFFAVISDLLMIQQTLSFVGALCSIDQDLEGLQCGVVNGGLTLYFSDTLAKNLDSSSTTTEMEQTVLFFIQRNLNEGSYLSVFDGLDSTNITGDSIAIPVDFPQNMKTLIQPHEFPQTFVIFGIVFSIMVVALFLSERYCAKEVREKTLEEKYIIVQQEQLDKAALSVGWVEADRFEDIHSADAGKMEHNMEGGSNFGEVRVVNKVPSLSSGSISSTSLN